MYIRPKLRTERPRKTKIGTEVAHVTRDSDTTFKVKRSKVNLQGTRAYCGGLPHSLLLNDHQSDDVTFGRQTHVFSIVSRPAETGGAGNALISIKEVPEYVEPGYL